MDKAALVDLLDEINAKSPPKPELVVKLGKMIAAEPAFFDVKGGVNRFDRAGYGYSAQVKRECPAARGWPSWALSRHRVSSLRVGQLPAWLSTCSLPRYRISKQ